MLFKVRVQSKSSTQRVERIGEGEFKVWLQSAPEGGKANAELIELIAGFFGVKKSAVRFVAGAKSRRKIVEVTL